MPVKDTPPQRDLSKFSSIISNLTLPLMVGKAVGLAEPSEQAVVVGEFARKLIEDQWVERVNRLKGDFFNPNARGGRSDLITGLELRTRKKELVEMFNAGVKALGSGSEEAFERAALALSHHLCASYERQDQPGLGFPLFGEGVRRSKSRVDGVTVKGLASWRGAFKDVLHPAEYGQRELEQEEADARDLLKPDLLSRQRLDESYNALPNIRSGDKSLINWANDVTGGQADYRDLTDGHRFGIDLAGKQRAVAKAEAPIPVLDHIELSFGSVKKLSLFNSGDRELIQVAGRRWKRFVGSHCSLAVLTLAGDKVDLSNSVDTQALRPMTYFSLATQALLNPEVAVSETSYHLRRDNVTPKAPTKIKIQELALRYEKAPLTFLSQLAFEIVAYNSHSPKEPESAAAGNFLIQLQASAKKLGERALIIANERQAEWLKKEGMDQAWTALKASQPNRLITSKGLNWALANPETTALSASGSKRDVFAANMARPLGVSAPDAETLWSRVAQRFASLGVTEETMEWAAGNAIGPYLVALAQTALPLRLVEKQVQLDAFAFASRLAEAARVKGIEPKMAFKVLDFALKSGGESQYRSFNTSGRSNLVDNLSDSVPFKELVDVKGALELERQSSAKKEKLGWLLGEMAAHFASSLDQGESAARQLRLELDAFSGRQAPQIDWVSLDTERLCWLDVVYRRPAAQAVAMREAKLNGGVPGLIAAACAPALGLTEAASGNDLIAQTREALKERWGMNNAGWRNFLKAPAEVIEAALAPMRQAEIELLKMRMDQQKTDQYAQRHHRSGVFQGAWISAMTQYNLPPEPVQEMLSLINRVGYVGFDPISEWGPFARQQSRGDAAGARFFIQEAEAKEQRLPHVIKAICEQYSARVKTTKEANAELSDEDAKKRSCSAVAEDWRLMADWIAKSEDGLWQTLPAKPTWNNLWRAQKEWHDEVAAVGASTSSGSKSKSNPGAIAWPSPLGKHVKGEWTAVELTNGSMLSEEGREMGHCVSSYSSNCRTGQLRIISIRFAGQRVCTLELRIKSNGSFQSYSEGDEGSVWAITQNKAKFNAAVNDPSALEFCEETRAAYQAAYSKKLSAEREAANKRAQERRVALKLKVEADVGAAPESADKPGDPQSQEPSAPSPQKPAAKPRKKAGGTA